MFQPQWLAQTHPIFANEHFDSTPKRAPGGVFVQGPRLLSELRRPADGGTRGAPRRPPRRPVRQRVLTLPHRLRYRLAWDPDDCRAVTFDRRNDAVRRGPERPAKRSPFIALRLPAGSSRGRPTPRAFLDSGVALVGSRRDSARRRVGPYSFKHHAVATQELLCDSSYVVKTRRRSSGSSSADVGSPRRDPSP